MGGWAIALKCQKKDKLKRTFYLLNVSSWTVRSWNHITVQIEIKQIDQFHKNKLGSINNQLAVIKIIISENRRQFGLSYNLSSPTLREGRLCDEPKESLRGRLNSITIKNVIFDLIHTF